MGLYSVGACVAYVEAGDPLRLMAQDGYTRILLIVPVCVSLDYRVIHSFQQDVDKHYACNVWITSLYTGLYTGIVENYLLCISLLH